MKNRFDNLYDISYKYTVLQCTEKFQEWIDSLDRSIAIRIDARLQRVKDGNLGFHKRFDHILEIKWKSGAMGSFRVYASDLDGVLILFGGHKGSQSKDIEISKNLLEGVKNGSIRTKIYE